MSTAYNGEIVVSVPVVRMRTYGNDTWPPWPLIPWSSLSFSVVQLVGLSQQDGRCPDVKRPNVVHGHLSYLFRSDSWMNTISRWWIRSAILRGRSLWEMRSVTTAPSSSGCPAGDGTGKVPKERRRLVLFDVDRRQSKIVFWWSSILIVQQVDIFAIDAME